MNVGIIGYGVVGTATAEVVRRLGHAVLVADTRRERVEAARDDGLAPLDGSEAVEILFLCVPEAHLSEALASVPESPITVIRSTVPPGTTDQLSADFHRPLVFMPEFLREATALRDALNPHLILIGSDDEREAETLRRLFEPLLAPVVVTSPATAEMVKLALNGYLHTLVSYWNEIHLICERLGIPSHVIGKIAARDPRVSSYGAGMHGRPVNGRCLPKDLAQLIALAEGLGLVPDLLKSAERVNREVSAHQAPLRRDGHAPQPLPMPQVARVSRGSSLDGDGRNR